MVTRGLLLQLTTQKKKPGRSFPTETYAWYKPLGESLRLCGRPPPADLRRQTLLALNASRTHSNTGCHSPYVHEQLSAQLCGTLNRNRAILEPCHRVAMRCNDTLQLLWSLPKTL